MKFDLVLEETDFSCAAEWTAHQEAIIKGLISVDPFNPVKLFSAVNYCNRRNYEAWGIQHPVSCTHHPVSSTQRPAPSIWDQATCFAASLSTLSFYHPVQFTSVTAQRISPGKHPICLPCLPCLPRRWGPSYWGREE